MKPDETGDTVEFAVRLQDVLVPLDSHFPMEKYKRDRQCLSIQG